MHHGCEEDHHGEEDDPGHDVEEENSHEGGDSREVPGEEETPKATKAENPKPTKLSALDAAAKVLSESKEPMRAKELIDAMDAKGYWKSPGGKTPHATLLREINSKGDDARFTKMDRGLFAGNG